MPKNAQKYPNVLKYAKKLGKFAYIMES